MIRLLIVLMFLGAGCTQQEEEPTTVPKLSDRYQYSAGGEGYLGYVTGREKSPCCTVIVIDTVYINLSFPVPIWTIDQHGRPIEGVRIDISELGSKRRMMSVTDSRGYTRPLLPEGKWRIMTTNLHLLFNDTTIEVRRAVNPVVLVSRALLNE